MSIPKRVFGYRIDDLDMEFMTETELKEQIDSDGKDTATVYEYRLVKGAVKASLSKSLVLRREKKP